MSIDFFAQLPVWPREHLDQSDWLDRMKMLLNNLDAQINAGVVDVVTVEASTEPSQATWETAYTTQTGKALPIPATARLIWWDTTNSQHGGVYGTLSNDDTVYPRGSLNSPGSIGLMESASLTASHTVDYVIGENLVNHPTVTVLINLPMKLRLIYSLVPSVSAASAGADFLINGVKAGTLYYSLASNRGIVEVQANGQCIASLETPTLNPGTYIIQAIFGRTNATTPTVTVASRQLFVRGIVQ
jgi:hypothetical protein